MSKRSLPPIPNEFFTLLGPIPVVEMPLAEAEAKEQMGGFDPWSRRIRLAEGLAGKSDWATLWHEAMHTALHDAGTDNALTEQQSEQVCDAVATYLTAMMIAGELTVHRKGSKTQT